MIARRTVLGGIVAVSVGGRTAHATPAAIPKEFRIGYQKSGVLVVARRQATIEAKLKELGIGSVRWIEFQYGPPLMEAIGVGAVDFGYVGDTPPIFA